MRNAFIRTLTELAEKDDRICLLVGDLGYSVVEEFAHRFPKRYLNAGVAEQNMMGIASGMALCGKVVFVYSIANFPTLRCLEQIRNDVCYHRADVKIVSVGAGLAYGVLGATHHATEDAAVLRVLPGMTVVTPGDAVEVVHATRALVDQPGPAYLRLGKSGEPRVHDSNIEFRLGKAILARRGDDLTIIVCGALLPTAMAVASRLAEEGVEVRVLSMHTLKPLDHDAVLKAAHETSAIITLEEHSVLGGLGSAVAETLAESSCQVLFKRIALPSVFVSLIGSQEYLRNVFSLSTEGILATAESFLTCIKSKTKVERHIERV
jgi:transketolase